MFKNPFRQQLADTLYTPVPVTAGPSPDEFVHSDVVFLDDAVYSDQTGYTPDAGQLGDNTDPSVNATYSQGDEHIELIYTPGPTSYPALDKDHFDPTPNIPGTNELTIHHGPVTGNVLDAYQEGNQTILASTPPGMYGPVGNTEPDYATRVAYANYQALWTDYSQDVGNYQQIAAI